MKPVSSAPVRSESLEHYLDRYADEYHRMGYSPREGRGRDEIILVAGFHCFGCGTRGSAVRRDSSYLLTAEVV
jgi:hypothetical protein